MDIDIDKDIDCSFIVKGEKTAKGWTQLAVIGSAMKFPARLRRGKTALIPFYKKGKLLWKIRVDSKLLNNYIKYANREVKNEHKNP